MNFWKSLAGMIEVEITSAAPEASLSSFIEANIEIHNIQKRNELTYSFLIPRNRYRNVKKICEKRGDTLKTQNMIGLFWLARKAVNRPSIMIGSLAFLILALWIPSKVIFVRVEGNLRVPDKKILEAAENCGIVFGASRREVRSERIKNALLSEVPELQWAGVNTSGCTATVSVREKAETEELDKTGKPASILAARDGYVLSCNATAGSLLVRPGDSVRKGQILISAYTDCGFSIRAEEADGEVIAQTRRSIKAIMPSQIVVKGMPARVKRKYSLLLRKKRIFLWKDSGIREGSCGRMYEEYYITLPGGFRLPVAFCVETYTSCETSPGELPEENTKTALKSFTEHYLSQQMVAGKILSGILTTKTENGRYCLQGDYVCVEMIGTARQEQIGDTNGKNS